MMLKERKGQEIHISIYCECHKGAFLLTFLSPTHGAGRLRVFFVEYARSVE